MDNGKSLKRTLADLSGELQTFREQATVTQRIAVVNLNHALSQFWKCLPANDGTAEIPDPGPQGTEADTAVDHLPGLS